MFPFYSSMVLILILLMYFMISFNVGKARMRYGVRPPATSGHPEFERVFRVQANTTENMVLFLPLFALATTVLPDVFCAIMGTLWACARVWYAMGYAQDSSKRMPGFVLSITMFFLLLIAVLIAITTR